MDPTIKTIFMHLKYLGEHSFTLYISSHNLKVLYIYILFSIYALCKLLHAPPVWRWIMLAQAPHYVESFTVRQTTFPISLNKIAWIFGLFDTRS